MEVAHVIPEGIGQKASDLFCNFSNTAFNVRVQVSTALSCQGLLQTIQAPLNGFQQIFYKAVLVGVHRMIFMLFDGFGGIEPAAGSVH